MCAKKEESRTERDVQNKKTKKKEEEEEEMSISPLVRIEDAKSMLGFVEKQLQIYKAETMFVILGILRPGCRGCDWYIPLFHEILQRWNTTPPVSRLGTNLESKLCIRFVTTFPSKQNWKEWIHYSDYPCGFLLRFDQKGQFVEQSNLLHLNTHFFNQCISFSDRKEAKAKLMVFAKGYEEIKNKILFHTSPGTFLFETKEKEKGKGKDAIIEMQTLLFKTENPKDILFPDLLKKLSFIEKENGNDSKFVCSLLLGDLQSSTKKNVPRSLQIWKTQQRKNLVEKTVTQISDLDYFGLNLKKILKFQRHKRVINQRSLADDLYAFLEQMSHKDENSAEMLLLHRFLIHDFQNTFAAF